MDISSNNRRRLLGRGLDGLAGALPPGWTVEAAVAGARDGGADDVIAIGAPDRRRVHLHVELKDQVEPRDAQRLIDRIRRDPRVLWLIICPYLGAAARALLSQAGVGYLDLTGNLYLQVSRPGIFVDRTGADRDPRRVPRAVATLRGVKAARIVRDLIEQSSPGTFRQIAARTATDVGYVSRVLTYLDEQALVTRTPRGAVERVDWPGLLRRWSADVAEGARMQATGFLEPRGLPHLLTKLATSPDAYAISGSLAAGLIGAIASPRLARLHVRDARAIASNLALRPADTGANVMLIESDDDLPLLPGPRPAWPGVNTSAIRYAAPAQVAADLLAGPGREPAEGEELIAWMRAHEAAWRA